MSAFMEWCQAMERTCQGKIVLSNLLHDFKEGRLSPELICRFLGDVVEKWKKAMTSAAQAEVAVAAPHSHECPLCSNTWKCMDAACQGVQENHCAPCVEHLLALGQIFQVAQIESPHAYLCQGRAPMANQRGCSRFTLAKDFVRDNICLSLVGWIERDDDGSTDVPIARIKELEEGLSREKIQEEKFPARSSLGWVTKTEEIQNLHPHTAGEERANIIREKLGLIHYQAGFQVLQVVYPDNALEATPLTPPTFLDGTPYEVYRSRKCPDGWGRTVDLSTGSDGLPEAVHRPVDLTERFVVHHAGKLPKPFPRVACPCQEVLRAVPHPWKPANVTKLQELIDGRASSEPAA